tara:strand:+ start:660 stop:890 length:231 start_codon:yes stop_codon:yes gene_type:complete
MDKLNIQNCIHVTRNINSSSEQLPHTELIGTFKFVDDTLYFFDIFSMEWEEYDHSFNILTKKEFREVMKNWRFNYG